MDIYTIGFTKKTAKEFFELLRKNRIKLLVDIRLNNKSQLAAFTKGNDLEFFLKELCGIEYLHDISLAPTDKILSDYKKNIITWQQYEEQFIPLLERRNKDNCLIDRYKDRMDGICFLCSEVTPEHCHRRLVAEFMAENIKSEKVNINHL